MTNENNAKMDHTKPVDKISFALAVFYIAKASIGAGILFVPACYQRLGLLTGMVVTGIGAWITAVTALWVAKVSRSVGSPDYVQIVGRLAGSHTNWAELVVTVVAIIMSTASLVVYLRIISDTCVNLLKLCFSFTVERDSASLLLALTIILPLSCIKGTSHLGWISLGGIIGMGYVIGIVILDCCTTNKPINDVILFKPIDYGSFAAVSSMLFAYASQFWTPQVALAMPSEPAPIIYTGTAVACVAYYAMGIAGYLRFGDAVAGIPVIQAYRDGASTPMSYLVAQVALSLVYLLSFPLKIAPLRVAIRRVFFSHSNTSQPTDTSNSFDLWHLAETTGIIAIIVAVSRWATASTMSVFDVVGAIGSSPIALILPALMAVRISGFRIGFRVVSIVLVGVLLMVSGVIRQFLTLFSDQH